MKLAILFFLFSQVVLADQWISDKDFSMKHKFKSKESCESKSKKCVRIDHLNDRNELLVFDGRHLEIIKK